MTLSSRLRLLLSAAAVLAALGGERLEACSCVAPLAGSHPCLDFWQADAVFAGRPVAVETIEHADVFSMERRFRFEVDEGFRGVETGGEVDVSSGMSSCGYEFRLGVPYVVYAYRDGGGDGLSTGICGRTRPAAQARDDLLYGRRAARGEQPTMVFGVAVRYDRGSVEEVSRPAPIAGATIRIEGAEDQAIEAETDAEGRFEAELPGAGSYGVTVDWSQTASSATLPPATEQSVSVAEGRCDAIEIAVDRLARVTGTLISAGGQPLINGPVRLLPAPADRTQPPEDPGNDWAGIDEHGVFTFERVFPGEYLVVAQPVDAPEVYYPGTADPADAQAVTAAAGETADLGAFVLPERRQEPEGGAAPPD